MKPHRITRERYAALMKDPLARPKLKIALEIGVFVIDDSVPGGSNHRGAYPDEVTAEGY